MKIFEKILAVVICIALIMKFFEIPGGGILAVISLGTLCFFYYFLGFAFFNQIGFNNLFNKQSYNSISALRMLGAIGAGTALSTLSLGVLYKLQYWTGGDSILISGFVSILIVLIVAIINYFRSKDVYYIRIFIRMAILVGLGILMEVVR